LNHWIYHVRPVQRRDVVILKTRVGWCGNRTPIVKRVIGIPGDRVRFDTRAVYVNGHLMTSAVVTRTRIKRPGRGRLIRLREGHYFVLGDNAETACDSRTHGPVTREMIVGKAIFVWSPRRRLRSL
jgi:signal peptidase I